MQDSPETEMRRTSLALARVVVLDRGHPPDPKSGTSAFRHRGVNLDEWFSDPPRLYIASGLWQTLINRGQARIQHPHPAADRYGDLADRAREARCHDAPSKGAGHQGEAETQKR